MEILRNKSILMTGGAGFIGSNIVEFLVNNNIKYVRIIDNLITGKMKNIQFLLDKYDNIEFVHGDISNLEDCRNAVIDMDVICHQAAIGSIPRSIKDPLSSHISNVNGFVNILVAAKEVGIKRIVYASSSSVYGDNMILPKVEANTGNVLSPYAATKAIDELYGGLFTSCYGMECIGLRYFNVFGPRQDPNGAYAAVIPKFISLMKSGKKPTINGDGSTSRDFTFVENVVQANILGLTTKNIECFGKAFNIGTGSKFSLLELITILNKELETNIIPIFDPYRDGDILHSQANIRKAIEMLGYNPKINFETGIKKLLKQYNKINSKYININDIDPYSFINRKEICINNIDELDYLNNKTILVTGGTGSIGSEIVRQLLNYNVKIIIYDNSEYGLWKLERDIIRKKKKNYNISHHSNHLSKCLSKCFFILGDINNYNKLDNIFQDKNIDIVFHAAAYKHVPILEINEFESININVCGTKNIADLSLKYNISKFIFVSTDKAVHPSSIMGCSKRVCEKYINYLWNTKNISSKTSFITTRFGNVFGSSGSVLPCFIENINNNINLQVTDENVTRYFMTIPEAARLELLVACIGCDNNKFIFDMGEPINIYSLAKNILKYFNITDLSIDILGLRPGEKMHEELSYNTEDILECPFKNLLRFKTDELEPDFIEKFNKLIKIQYKDSNMIRTILKSIEPTYI